MKLLVSLLWVASPDWVREALQEVFEAWHSCTFAAWPASGRRRPSTPARCGRLGSALLMIWQRLHRKRPNQNWKKAGSEFVSHAVVLSQRFGVGPSESSTMARLVPQCVLQACRISPKALKLFAAHCVLGIIRRSSTGNSDVMRMMALLIQLINESEHSLSHGTQSDVASEAMAVTQDGHPL